MVYIEIRRKVRTVVIRQYVRRQGPPPRPNSMLCTEIRFWQPPSCIAEK